jgi:pimeloyl-ACP methyl ester carboxylesterase
VYEADVAQDKDSMMNPSIKSARATLAGATRTGWQVLVRYGPVCAALWICTAFPSYAAQVTWQEDMVCGKDPQRPDHQPGLARRYVVTPSGTIAYYRFGQGSPIVLVTGYRATMSNWNAYFLGELAQRHEVIVLDNRGIGDSVSDTTRYGMADLARDTLTLIQTLKLRDVTLLGWSMGGMVAQTLLMQHPDRIRDAVLMNTAPPGWKGDNVPPEVMRVLSGSPSTTFGQVMSMLFPPNAVQQAEQCFRSDMFKPGDYGSVGIPARVTQQQDALLSAWTADKRAFGRLRDIGVPTLVLSAQNDAVLAPANGAVLNEAIPGSSFVEASDAGHAMMYQYPRALAQRIIKFIETGR